MGRKAAKELLHIEAWLVAVILPTNPPECA
jgi:hypothetical protein